MHFQNKFTIIIPPQDIKVNPDCVQRLAAGDKGALEWVYKNYSKKMFDYALLITANKEQSEDIVHDIFLRLWEKREKLREVENFNGYLYIIARNITASTLRKKTAEKCNCKKFISTQPGFNDPLREVIEKKEILLSIARAVEQLPPQQKLVYQLRRQCGWKTSKVAEKLNLAPSTVDNHLKKGTKSIMKFVKKIFE